MKNRRTLYKKNKNKMRVKTDNSTFASFVSVDCFWASADLSDATFIFFACSRICFSWLNTAYKYQKESFAWLIKIRIKWVYLDDKVVGVNDQE